jgi:hypothetical protein
VGLTVSWASQWRGVHNVEGSGRTTVLQGRRRHQLGSGKMAACKGGSTMVGSDGTEALGRT